jgi:glycosyltransferase involved in cell wall biosynthesis
VRGRYALITPARNEAENLRRLAGCLAVQTAPPGAWVIVDDGSSDATRDVAAELAAQHEWIHVLDSPGAVARSGPVAHGRSAGRDVVAFHAGLASLDGSPEFVVKLDADVSIDAEYFQLLLERFDADPSLGIAGGTCYEQNAAGEWRPRYVTRSHVRGATRVWRRTCLDELLPLPERLGWDVVDELQARTNGWRTASFDDLHFRHHRAMGARDGARAAWSAQGEVAYYAGYRFAYLVVRAVYRAFHEPAALAMLMGYLGALLRHDERFPDPAVRDYLRRQQSLRALPLRAREALGRTQL